MPEQALVILGAGASRDLLPEDQFGTGSINADFRPPLTDGLFSSSREFQRILQDYPDAGTLAESIRALPSEVSLEHYLRSLAESDVDEIRRQFKEVPLYLQNLFGEISQQFLRFHDVSRLPANYTYLVNELLARYDRVAFLTLNYDLFLEQTLAAPSLAGGPPRDMDWYIQEKWLLVKAHGSVNWGRKILSYPGSLRNDNAGQLSQIGDVDVSPANLGEIEILPKGHRMRWLKGEPYYPALVVPVEGKYDLTCPSSHLDALSEFLANTQDVLVIGVSAKDADVLDLLRATLPQVWVYQLVDRGEQNLKKANDRLIKGVPQLRSVPFADSYDGGFTSFVRSAGVQKLWTAHPQRQ